MIRSILLVSSLLATATATRGVVAPESIANSKRNRSRVLAGKSEKEAEHNNSIKAEKTKHIKVEKTEHVKSEKTKHNKGDKVEKHNKVDKTDVEKTDVEKNNPPPPNDKGEKHNKVEKNEDNKVVKHKKVEKTSSAPNPDKHHAKENAAEKEEVESISEAVPEAITETEPCVRVLYFVPPHTDMMMKSN